MSMHDTKFSVNRRWTAARSVEPGVWSVWRVGARGLYSVLCLFLAALIGGCAGISSDAQPLRFTASPTILQNPNPSVPLAAIVRFEVNQPVCTVVEVSDGEYRWALWYDNTQDTRKGLPVIGMRPDRDHTIVVRVEDAHANSVESGSMTYRTPPLPDDAAEFPAIEVKTYDAKAVEPGYTVFNPRRRIPDPADRPPGEEIKTFNQGFGMLAAVDERGEVVWYYRGDSRISDFRFLRNGNIVFITQDNRFLEIDLLGNVVTQWYAAGRPEGGGSGIPVDTLTFHHCVDETPDGGFIILGTDRHRIDDYYTSATDPDAPRRAQWVMGDEIIEFDRGGNVLWRWNAFDHLDPFRIGYQTFSGYWKRRGWPKTVDWTHANSVSYLADDNAVLCNMRYQSAILKIDRETGRILWIAGEPTGWLSKLQDRLLRPANFDLWFWHQHAPEMTPQGTIILFNNDNFRARPFDEPEPPSAIRSHAAEYRIDEASGVIEKMWSSLAADEQALASWAMGSARVMPETGNVLAGYGFMFQQENIEEATWQNRQQFKGTTRIREYTRREPTRLVWQLTLGNRDSASPVGWNLYGARRVKQLLQAK